MFVTVGIIYMLIGVLGKLSAVFIMIPEPVLGGALMSITAVFIGLYLFSFVFLNDSDINDLSET